MKGISKYIVGSASDPKGSGVVLTGAAAAITDGNMVEIDLGNQDLDREFVLAGRITPNTTAPGANTWLALNWYWSDFKIVTPATNVPLLCPTRKYSSGPIVLPNLTLANNGERYLRYFPGRTIPLLTLTRSTTTATLTFPPNTNPNLWVGQLVRISGGTAAAGGTDLQGVFAIGAVTHTSGANGQIVTTATFTCVSNDSGTLVGPTLTVVNEGRNGALDSPDYGIMRPHARFLYTSFDRSALTANATTEVVLALVRVPGREKMF